MKRWFIFLSILIASLELGAQELAVSHAQAPQQVPFAQPFTASVVLSHPQGDAPQLVPDSVSEDFAVVDTQFQPVGPTQTQADLTVIPFTIHKSTFTASFALSWQPQATAQAVIPLEVSPVKLFDDNELREIRPPHRFFDWVLLLCILLALAVIVCLIIFWIRRMQKDGSDTLSAPVDNRPAHVIALAKIDALVDSGLWENKQYKVFYITLSDILREYLQRAFGLDVSADTSAELLRRIKTVQPLVPLSQALRSFLSSGDLVKFAKVVPSEQTRNQDVTALREIITQTTPKPVPPAPHVEVKL